MALEIRSTAFSEGETMPQTYTCDGEDVSPPLEWTGAPPDTASFALVCVDPDAPAGTWVHWVAYGIPGDADGLPEGVPTEEITPDGWTQGRNDFKRIGYGGPCPPAGDAHRYFFKLYALDVEPELDPGATEMEMLQAVEEHVLEEAQTMGRYAREG